MEEKFNLVISWINQLGRYSGNINHFAIYSKKRSTYKICWILRFNNTKVFKFSKNWNLIGKKISPWTLEIVLWFIEVGHHWTPKIPFKNPGDFLTFNWFKKNVICADQPWICSDGSENQREDWSAWCWRLFNGYFERPNFDWLIHFCSDFRRKRGIYMLGCFYSNQFIKLWSIGPLQNRSNLSWDSWLFL